MKDKDLEKYYEDQLELFATKGWKALIEKTQEIKSVSGDIARCNSEKELFFQKGQLDVLNWLLNWESLVRTAMEQYETDV